MHDIWAFLLQTLTVSLVALFLLVLKAIFQDKLSPRWQYGVWLILAARVLIPAGVGGQMFLPLERWVELLKLAAEVRLSSAYTGVWATTAVTAPFPLPAAAPQSVTDWLFCLYAAGVVLSLLWFFLGYLRLRLTLTPAPDRAAHVERVARQYNLPFPRVAEGPIPSAFVCSPLHPVLVLPRGRPVDDKVILHELLHLKYGDLWLNLLSCLLRCLHWCNPFLWKVFDRVGNDAEALCDQRVLERLAGEDRRDYGRILLSMADDRYPRLPGTTSMANGGRNIKARIRSIARFKRYPGGMALVSLCIVAILIPSCLTGTAGAAQLPSVSHHEARARLEPEELRAVLLRGFATARTCRPTTVAGALDCYAKAVINNNAYYLAAVSGLEKQQELYQTLLVRNGETWEWGNFYLDMGLYLSDLPGRPYEDRRYTANGLSPYLAVNLQEKGGGYTASVVFPYEYYDNESYSHTCYIVHQVELIREGDGWLVESLNVSEPVETSYSNVIAFAWGDRYFPGLDLGEIAFPGQDGLQASLHIQRFSLFSDDTLSSQSNDHSAMICGFGNNLTCSPDLDAQFMSSKLYGCLEIRYSGASPGTDYCADFECIVYAGEKELHSGHTSGFIPLWPQETDSGRITRQIAVSELETDNGALADHIQFSFTLAEKTGDDSLTPIAHIPLHTEQFELKEVLS